MKLGFIPPDVLCALERVDTNLLSEIRLRVGQPVIICYGGQYVYLGYNGAQTTSSGAICCDNPQKILYSAMEGSVFAYTEQLSRAFITVDGGVRIGIAGEYVLHGGRITSVKNVTSLNIRIPHDVYGCADGIIKACGGVPHDILLYSSPGQGKTTLLRDIARKYSDMGINVLVCDERGEISAADESGKGYFLGEFTDVVRGADKVTVFTNAIRALSPQVIITDELYGETDFNAVNIARECGICTVASTHVNNINALMKNCFEYYISLSGVKQTATVYDKNFNFVCDCATVGYVGGNAFRPQEKESKDIRRVL